MFRNVPRGENVQLVTASRIDIFLWQGHHCSFELPADSSATAKVWKTQ